MLPRCSWAAVVSTAGTARLPSIKLQTVHRSSDPFMSVVRRGAGDALRLCPPFLCARRCRVSAVSCLRILPCRWARAERGLCVTRPRRTAQSSPRRVCMASTALRRAARGMAAAMATPAGGSALRRAAHTAASSANDELMGKLGLNTAQSVPGVCAPSGAGRRAPAPRSVALRVRVHLA